MIRSPRRKGSIKNSALILLAVLMILQIIMRSFSSPIEFEKGIEIVRSKGYDLDGDSTWQESVPEGYSITEKKWNGFLKMCQQIQTSTGNVVVYTDYTAKVMYVLYRAENPGEPRAYYCQFH